MLVSISAKAKPRDENNRTLNSLTAVQLPSDVYEKYVATFFPKKRVRTGLSANHFGPLAQYLAEVTAYVQVTMSNLRAIHNYSTVLDLNDHDQNSGRRNIAMFVRDREQDRALSSADRLVADDVIKSADLDSASLHKALAADAAQKFLMSMSRGNNAVIREGRGEKEPCVYFDLLGSRLGNTSPTLNEVYTESNFIPALASEHVLLEETELGKHVLAAGREIISGITGAGADNAVREYMRFALDFDVAEFVEGVLAKHRLSEAACRFRPSAPRELKFFSEGYRLVIVKEPEIEAVNAKRSESRVKFNEAATVLSQHINVTLSLRVPMEMARYAAQAVGNEKLSMQSLNSWINLWCFGFMRSKGSKVTIRPADIPRYVMPPSTAFALAERRRQLGLYVEPGRTNADRLTVSAKGGLQYMPNNGEVDQNLSKQYEADQEKILAECFRLGIPLTTESENEFARVDPQVDEKLKLLAENLKQYSGALLSNSWDYNCAMVVNINEPERNHAIRLAGSTIPDELVLSKFLSEPTGTALRHMFTEARMYDAEDEKVIPYDETKLSNSSVVNVTTFTHLIRSYLYLREINAAQPLEKLISMAAAELKLDRLEDSPYEKGLYQPYLDNTMRLTEAALQKLPQALSSIIGDAFTDASGEPGSNVLRVTAKEDRELEEDDHYFNVKFHRFDEIGRVYNYLGGRVLYHIARAILEAPREALLSPTKGTDIQRPAFQHVSDLVLPFATALVRYVPDAKRIHEVAEKLQETLIPDDNFEASQLKIPGLKDDFRLFPHQADAFKTLSRFPRYALLDVAPGGGKCLVGDTLVHTHLGLKRLDEIRSESGADLPQAGFKSYDKKLKVRTLNGRKHVTKSFKRQGETWLTTLENGITFEGLDEHRLWTQDGWKRLDELNSSHFVPVYGEYWWPKASPQIQYDAEAAERLNIDVRNLPRLLTDDLALLAGLLVAEGNIPFDGNHCGFGVNEKDVMSIFVEAYARTFGRKPDVKVRKARNENCKPMLAVRADKEAAFVLRTVAGVGTSQYKEVSATVRAGTKSQHAAFLRGYFEGDGSVTCGTGRKAKRARLSVGTISKVLAQQVAVMLINFGLNPTVIAKVGKTYVSANGNAHIGATESVRVPYVVSISQRDVELFAKEIGFAGKRKSEGLRKSVDFVSASREKSQTTNYDVFGYENFVPAARQWNELLKRIESLCGQFEYEVPFGSQTRKCVYALTTLIRDTDSSRKYIVPRDEHITRGHIAAMDYLLSADNEVAEFVASDRLVKSLRKEINKLAEMRWTRVESSVETGQVKDVYDIEVEEEHCYAANGYMSHNTTLLLVDIANMIAHGKIKRPLVICPSNLAKDWCAEMHRHTEGKWNMIPINGTAWSSSWGDATLTDMIKNAPPNTVVVVGYDFLSAMHTYKYPVVIGTHVEMVSEPLEFLKKFGFDYIGIDESHRTKRFGKNGARPSVRHSSAKAITTMSCVKYIRLGTGSFVYNDMSDPVGQAALFGAHIYRTLDEYEEENKTTIEVDGRRVTVWREDTPYKARKRLGEYAAVVSARRRDWAFMLPIPIETFIPVNLEKRPEDDGYELLKDIPDAHLLCYNTVLNTTLEEIRQNPRIMALLNGAGSEDDDDGSDSEGASKRLVGNATIDVQQSDDDESVVDKLESALAPYLQRLDRLLTDPLGDTDAAGNPFGELFFRGIQAKDFVSNVVLAVIKRLRIHFTPNPWRKGESYKPQTVVDFGNRTFIARPEQSVHADAFTSVQAPDIDTKNWSEQARGKVIIFCRYKRTVDAIMRALPEDFARTAVGFHGGIKNRADNLDRFKKDDRVQIIVAQESAISEGHNMQMASRIIRVETPWAPGELDQAISRIFRPDPRSKFKRETIFLDWVLVNNTLSVAKLGRIISKIVHKAKFDEATNPLYDDLNSGDLPVISMSIDNLRDLRNLSDISDYLHEYQKLARITAKEFIDMRKTRRMEMIDVPPSPMMPGASVIPFTPLVLGQEVPDRDNVGVIRYADYMQRVDDPDVQAITADPRILVGRYARTEFGYGVIESVTRRSAAADGEEEDSGIRGWRLSMATIRYANGSTGDVPASMLYLTPDMDEKIYAKYGGSIKKPTERDRREATKIKNVVPQRERDGQDRMRQETTSFVEEATRRSVISGTLAQRLDALFDQGRKDIVPVPPKKVKEVLPANTDLSTFDPRDDIAEVQREGQLFVTLYNGFWCVEVDAIESTDRWLKKQFGFETGVSYAYFKVANRNNYRAALDWLDRNFTIPATSRKRLDAFDGAFSGSGRNPGFRAELSPVGEMQSFLTERHRMTRQAGTKPTINVYPLLLNDNLLFVVDLGTNPGIVKHIGKAIPKTSPVAKIGQVDSISMKFFRQRSDVVQFINELRKKMKVLNYADVKEDFNNLKTIAAKLK